MKIDDDSSVYVGGLPYNATEDSIRKIFNLYGSVVAVKIVRERGTRGKCYGFVTFTNPRSAIDAINDMNGRTIDGRIVRVSEVTTRGGKSNFGREHSRRSDWDTGQDRERDNDRNRDRYWDHYSDKLRERSLSRDCDRDRGRGYEHAHDHDPSRDHYLDGGLEDNEQGYSRNCEDWERNNELDFNRDRDIDVINDYRRSFHEGKDYLSRKHNGSSAINDQLTRELSSNSSDDCSDQVKEHMDRSIQMREDLKKEISQMEERVHEKEQLVLDLQKKSKKLEDALVNAKKLSSHHQKQLTKLYKCFMQVKEYSERLRSSEQELQSVVDVAMIETDTVDDVGLKDGGVLTNGNA